MLSKRTEYQVDHCAAKVAKFFLMCESHIDPDMRIKIPAAMMAKGYSNKEYAADAGLPGGGKNQGIGSPPPSQGSGHGRNGPVDSFGPPKRDESHSCNDYSRCSSHHRGEW